MKLGVNRENQKNYNRGLIMKLIATGQCKSRVELSRVTGLTKPAISQIVADLIAKDLLVEMDKECSPELGRNPVILGISPDGPKIAGVLIQRGYAEAVLCDLNLSILKRERIDREWYRKEELLQDIVTLVDRIVEGESRIAGIGVSSIGPVSTKDGKILFPLRFNGIGDIEIKSFLEKKYRVPVGFDHDNQSAAMVEFFYGNAKGFQDILLIGVSKGVGCGIIVGGQRVQNAWGNTPEIGHMSLDPNGAPCVCGNRGCLENYIRSEEIKERLYYASGKRMEYQEYFETLSKEELDSVMIDVVDKLSFTLINTINMMNPQVILFSDDCCFWPDEYLQKIEDHVNRLKFVKNQNRIFIRKTAFLQDCKVLGAACNGFMHIFRGEIEE